MWLIIKLYLGQTKKKASLCQLGAGMVAIYKTWSRNTTRGKVTASQEEHCRIMLEGQAASPSMEQGWQEETGTSLGPGTGHWWWVRRGFSCTRCPTCFPKQGIWNHRTFQKVFFGFFVFFGGGRRVGFCGVLSCLFFFFLIKFWGLR